MGSAESGIGESEAPLAPFFDYDSFIGSVPFSKSTLEELRPYLEQAHQRAAAGLLQTPCAADTMAAQLACDLQLPMSAVKDVWSDLLIKQKVEQKERQKWLVEELAVQADASLEMAILREFLDGDFSQENLSRGLAHQFQGRIYSGKLDVPHRFIYNVAITFNLNEELLVSAFERVREVYAGKRPQVHWDPANIHVVMREVQALVNPIACNLFRQDKELVQVRFDEGALPGDPNKGHLSVFPLPLPSITVLLNKAMEFSVTTVYKDGSARTRACICPKEVAETFLADPKYWGAPELRAITDTPTMDIGGEVIQHAGYHRETQVYYNPGQVEYPYVPSDPTKEDALAAFNKLWVVFEDFPFVDEHDKSIAIAIVLTSLIRSSLPAAPMFVVNATSPGTGKTLLAKSALSISIARGAATTNVAKAGSEEEWKSYQSLLLGGHQGIVFDNVDAPVQSTELCIILTSPTWTHRKLSTSNDVTVSTASTFVVTGNGVVIKGDLATRCIRLDLDAKCENPEQRPFKRVLPTYIAENRPELAVAGLTILRAFQVCNQEERVSTIQSLTPMRDFVDWTERVRAAIVWLGMADPCLGCADLLSENPEKSEIDDVFFFWFDRFGTSGLTVKELLEDLKLNPPGATTELKEALQRATSVRDNDDLDSTAVGKRLAKMHGREVGGKKLVDYGVLRQAKIWAVVDAELYKQAGEPKTGSRWAGRQPMHVLPTPPVAQFPLPGSTVPAPHYPTASQPPPA